MRYYALACDYDGTLAQAGRVDEATVAALVRLRRSGRKAVLVTGRLLPDLIDVFPHLELFDQVVAENGALLYTPATREERVLADPPPSAFVDALRQRGVAPVHAGRVIVGTWEPHQATVLDVIRERGLELQVIFNKGAVMVLPTGANKATGLEEALHTLGLSLHNVVAVGDAENDHAFMSAAECAIAVANALPVIKDYADWVTAADHGAGVAELIDRLVASDLSELGPQLSRHDLLLGAGENEEPVRVPPYGVSLLLAGSSGAGKSTFATALLERLSEQGRQFCIIDPEGDYETLESAVVLGDHQHPPAVAEAVSLLDTAHDNVVVNLVGVAREHRPAFFDGLFTALLQLRVRTGRPHWLVIDEAHHLLPASWSPADLTVPAELQGVVFITVHPNRVSAAALSAVDLIIAIGAAPDGAIRGFSEALGEAAPAVAPGALEPGEAVAWWRRPRREPFRFRSIAPRTERRRHLRKYAAGDLGPHAFYFRGPDERLNLRAQNLLLFMQMAEGLDDDTWLHHLHRGDYSTWFREAIKDPELANAAEQVERARELSAQESRARIKDEIARRYTEPA
jgi:hypothetical protein